MDRVRQRRSAQLMRLRLIHALLLGLLWLGSSAHAQLRVADVSFAPGAAVDGVPLALNGAGLRTRLLFKVYAMGLYVSLPTQDADQLIAAPAPKHIRIVLLRELEARQFTDALTNGLQRNHDDASLAALHAPVQTLTRLILAHGRAPAGTEITLDQLADGSTRLAINGALQGAPIDDSALYPALLRIWLGERPADRALKAALLQPLP